MTFRDSEAGRPEHPSDDRAISSTPGGGDPADGNPPVRIRAIELLDPDGPAFLPRRDVLLVGGRIAPDDGRAMPADTVVLDGSSLSALPGFVDAHYHCSYAGHVGVGQLERPLEDRVALAKANLVTALRHGITSVLDVGSHGTVAVIVRDAVRSGSVEGPAMRVSGRIVVKAGGPFGDRPDARPEDRLFHVVRDRRGLERAILEQADLGVDAIKLQISSSAVQSDHPPRDCVFSASELRLAVKLCHALGLILCVHAEGDTAIRTALRGGVDVIQHGTFASRATLQEIKATGTGLVFTPGVYRAIGKNGPDLGYPAEGLQRVARHWPAIVETIRIAAEIGVPFGVGSDAGGAVHPHGEYLEDVVSLIEDCRLPVAFALAAATRGSARAGRIDGAGTLMPGERADLVLVDSATLRDDVNALRHQANLTVIHGGRIIARTRSPGSPASSTR